MTTRIAKNGDRVRCLLGYHAGEIGRVLEDGTDTPELVDDAGEGFLWLFAGAEGEVWEFVDEIPAEELATAIGLNFEGKVDEVLADVKAKLIAKNNQYGNSALEPIRAFSKLNPVEQLLIRIDDKISRLQKGDGTGDEDAEADTLGYLILLAIARKDSNA